MRHLRTTMLVAAVAAGLLVSGCTEGTEKVAAGSAGPAGEPERLDGAPPVGGPPADTAAGGAEAPPPAGATPGVAQQGGLRAGSVDDNADYERFLTYLDRLAESGVATRPFDARGRVLVSVIGSDDLPLPGAVVSVSAGGGQVATLRTTADGTARFWPGLYGTEATSWEFSAGGSTVEASPGGQARLVVDTAVGRDGAVAVDVHFLIDATGSMWDEIDQLKATISTVAERIEDLPGSPRARFGMTRYRDEGDDFVTSTYDLTGDLPAFQEALSAVRADGGGDYPEALDEGLAAALAEPGWGDPSDTLQLVFLIADAPPQVGRQVATTYPQSAADAVSRGLKIFPIASSESDDQAEAVFRQLAAATGSRFVFLSYGAQGAATGANSDITVTDYEEMSLDDLVVRLVSEEVGALTGTGAVLPPATPSPSPSTPPGQ